LAVTFLAMAALRVCLRAATCGLVAGTAYAALTPTPYGYRRPAPFLPFFLPALFLFARGPASGDVDPALTVAPTDVERSDGGPEREGVGVGVGGSAVRRSACANGVMQRT
jgi:hypothetical protein